jgi:phosphoribosyl-dephospho-CoA transferase
MTASSPARPLRHRRVWLRPALGRADIAGCDDPAALDMLIDWTRQGRALVGRGALPQDTPGWIPLGLARREAGRRQRLALCVPASAVLRVEEPLSLAEVAPGLPPAMRGTALQLVRQASEIGVPLRVYGSAFWQHASGEPCLHDRSDLDLLAQPASADAARRWLAALAQTQAASTVRLDGEVELPSGEAVAWRELAGSTSQVLVKSDTGPRLAARALVWSAWADAATAVPC